MKTTLSSASDADGFSLTATGEGRVDSLRCNVFTDAFAHCVSQRGTRHCGYSEALGYSVCCREGSFCLFTTYSQHRPGVVDVSRPCGMEGV